MSPYDKEPCRIDCISNALKNEIKPKYCRITPGVPSPRRRAPQSHALKTARDRKAVTRTLLRRMPKPRRFSADKQITENKGSPRQQDSAETSGLTRKDAVTQARPAGLTRTKRPNSCSTRRFCAPGTPRRAHAARHRGPRRPSVPERWPSPPRRRWRRCRRTARTRGLSRREGPCSW